VSEIVLPFDLHVPHWFVLFVRSNQEKRTAQRLAAFEIEHFLPCYRSLRQWKDRRVSLEVPLFPGYVFVRLPWSDRNRVLTLPHVLSLVGRKNSPSVVSEEEIDTIQKGITAGNATPHPVLSAGQRVLITSGVLCGMQGTLLRTQNGTRVVVAIESIYRGFAVDVDIECLRPMGLLNSLEQQAG